MEFGEILAKVAQEVGVSLSDMAEALGEHRNKLYNLKGGRWNPNYEFCRKLLEAYPQLNAEFVMTGKGPALRTETPVESQEVTPVSAALEETDKDLIIEALTEQLRRYKKQLQESEGI